MNIRILWLPLAALMLALVLSGNAHAAATCSVDDVLFAVSPDNPESADACFGPTVGNNNDPDGLHDFEAKGDSWQELAKWDDPDKFASYEINVDGVKIQFTLSSAGTSNDHREFELEWQYTTVRDSELIPVTTDFNFVVKHSKGFVEYYFKDQILAAADTDPPMGTGEGKFRVTFKCTGKSNGGQNGGGSNSGSCNDAGPGTEFSHFSVYGRDLRPNENGNDRPREIQVPEPATIGLLGIGLLGLGVASFRRRRIPPTTNSAFGSG